MSYRKASALTSVVELSTTNEKTGKPYSVQVRALRGDEEDAVQAIFLGGGKTKAQATTVGTETSSVANLEFDNAALLRETCLKGIVSWDLDGDPGDDVDTSGILKVTIANLACLTGGDRNKIFTAINDLTEPPSVTEKKG